MRALLLIGTAIALLPGCAPGLTDPVEQVDPGQVSAMPVATARVAVIAEQCANCHGTEARLASAIPALAGADEAMLRDRLLAFKRGEAPDGTVMPRLAAGYSEAELKAVARHFAALQPE
jgi:cytochrome c553